jgi:hypothetical protein
MKSIASVGAILLLLAACGDSGTNGSARTAGELCDEVCAWPDACFAELGVPVADAECIASCEESVQVVGLPCLQAINNTVSCLGTCDFNALTDQQILACSDEAEVISAACD